MNNDSKPEEFNYDDGVVSFGTLTENQIERFKRLPRHTVLPSDIQLSQSFLDTDRDDHDESNDQSIAFLNESKKNSIAHFDNMNCTTQLTNNFGKEKETGTIELKQSFVDESSSFSSPSAVKFFPSTKLLDTDVVNRYMHKKSISSNESLSEYQNTTTIADEFHNFLDDQESVVTLANSTCNKTEDCEQLSVLNVIDQRQIQKKIPDNANNVCTLKPCSLNGEDEDEDISICNDTELLNTSDSSEDSIIVEKYSVTPGKQRLYDVRHTKPAFHTKNLGTAAPFMERIEETVTSVPRILNSPLILVTSPSISVTELNFNGEPYANKLSTNNDGIYLNKSSNDTTIEIEEIMDATEYNFDTKKSMNNVSKLSVKTTDSSDYHDNESIAVDLEITSTNTSVMDTKFDDEPCANNVLRSNNVMNLNESTNQIKEIIDATEVNFDTQESMNNMSELSVKTTDLLDYHDNKSIAVDLEIASINTSVVNTKIDDKLCTNKLSSNENGLMCIEIDNTDDYLKVTESKIDADKSLNNTYNTNVNETSQLSELDISVLKNLTNIDISYAEEKSLSHSSEILVTNNRTPQNSSRAMRQYLDFEQNLYEICNPKLNNSTINDSQTHRNILLTEQTIEPYLNDSFSTSAHSLESNLSVIIENRTLEENSSDVVMQNEEFENPINTVLENIVNENLENIVLNESATLNNKESLVVKDILQPEVLKLSIENEMENNTSESVMKSNGDIFIDDSNIGSKLLFVDNKVISSNEKMNEIKCNESCSISSNKFLKAESNVLLNKDIESLDLLGETRNINNSLNEFINMEQMFNFGENQKVQMLNLDTPKTQKILDFSIVPQTPTVESHAKKQKLLNFSIVDQTPISKDTQQKLLNNLSGMSEILELEKDFQNCINNSSSKNLSTISAPDTESFIDVSINSDNSIINQTLTETNLNNPTHSYKINESNTNTVGNNMDSIEYCIKESIPEVVKSITNCASNITFNQNSKKLDCSTILMDLNEKIITKSNKNAIVDFSIIEQPIPHTFEINNDTNITFVESKTNVSNLIDSSVVSMNNAKTKEHVFDSSQNPIVVVSSDTETEKSLTSTLDYCSVNNSTNHLEQSTFSHNSELLTDVQMNDLSLSIESEKSSVSESFHSIELDHVKEDKKRKLEPIQDYHNFEKIMRIEAKDPELDNVQEDNQIKIEPVQVNYNSEKNLKVKSKDTDSDHVQEEKKRKIKPVHDLHNSEKKMKVDSEEPKTPMSMLYKIKNMFKSNEKLPQYKNNTKSENRLNFNKLKDDKPEVLVKSKIPYKVTNTPRTQNDEFNNSKSLNDNKSKKGIPKFIGLPALSDLSNKTFPGTDSKYH